MPFTSKNKNKLSLEHFHSLLWLLKDMCWLQLWPVVGPIILVPTVGLAVFISWKSFSDRFQFFQNLSVMLWLSANATWMVGELFYDDTTRPSTCCESLSLYSNEATGIPTSNELLTRIGLYGV